MTKPDKALPTLDREKRSAKSRDKILTWSDPDWHVFVDKDNEVYLYYIKDSDVEKAQYQVFRGIWSSGRYLDDHLVPVDITGYVVPEGYRYSGASVGSFIRTNLTITRKLPLLKSVHTYNGDVVCVEDLILGGDKPMAVISHNDVGIPYIEEVDANLLKPHNIDDYGYNPCTSFGELTKPEVRRVPYQETEKELEKPRASFCNCSMQTLMRGGCKCGGA